MKEVIGYIKGHPWELETDAEFIVRAVNSHEALVTHLKHWLSKQTAKDEVTLRAIEASIRVLEEAGA